MEILILAVLIGLIPAVIAKNKGHSFVVWWVFGAALFIVALPAAILIKPDSRALEQSKLGEGMKKCPFCAELIKPEAAVCRYCGRELHARHSMTAAHRSKPPPPPDVFLYYGDQQHGPFSLDTVRQMRTDATIPTNAFFWLEGFSDWLPISELERSFT